MRLINVTTYELREFQAVLPSYAILSHRWEDEEIGYKQYIDEDYMSKKGRSTKGWMKIKKFCDLFAHEGLWPRWVWVDTCCIDKSSSAELSEAINSMFQWYRRAKICIVFMSDVHGDYNFESFHRSAWFTRGWTLQELIAPIHLEFYNSVWSYLGSRKDECIDVSEATGIPMAILYDPLKYNFEWASVAQRMSWAAKRRTTRSEDLAYSLLGLFGVNMPLLYGEGEFKAFQRLQTEILAQNDDDSIFAWIDHSFRDDSSGSMLASHPFSFRDTSEVRKISAVFSKLKPSVVTNMGINMGRTLYPAAENSTCWIKGDSIFTTDTTKSVIMPLACDDGGQKLAVCLEQISLENRLYARVGRCRLTDILSNGEFQEILIRRSNEDNLDFVVDEEDKQNGMDWDQELWRLEESFKRDLVVLGNYGPRRSEKLKILDYSCCIVCKRRKEESGPEHEHVVVLRGSQDKKSWRQNSADITFQAALRDLNMPKERAGRHLALANKICSLSARKRRVGFRQEHLRAASCS